MKIPPLARQENRPADSNRKSSKKFPLENVTLVENTAERVDPRVSVRTRVWVRVHVCAVYDALVSSVSPKRSLAYT